MRMMIIPESDAGILGKKKSEFFPSMPASLSGIIIILKKVLISNITLSKHGMKSSILKSKQYFYYRSTKARLTETRLWLHEMIIQLSLNF